MLWLLLGCIAQASSPQPWKVALTLDDIPWQGAMPEGGVAEPSARILASLQRHEVPAVAFVNCERAWPEALRQWRAAGVELGNHQATHADLEKSEAEAWLEGVHSCTEALTVEGTKPRYFRYPYLRRSSDEAKRDRVRAEIEASGLQIASVTIDNHEWMLAREYAAGDARAAELYARHLVDASRHFRTLSRKQAGREVPQVLLLHANLLAADHLDEALLALKADGAQFVPLDEVLADPFYAQPDTYVGPGGISWVYRVDGSLLPRDGSDWDTAEWKRLEAALSKEP